MADHADLIAQLAREAELQDQFPRRSPILLRQVIEALSAPVELEATRPTPLERLWITLGMYGDEIRVWRDVDDPARFVAECDLLTGTSQGFGPTPHAAMLDLADRVAPEGSET